MFGMRDPRLQLAVIGQHQQPLAVTIQPAGGIDAFDLDEIGQSGTCAALVGELRQAIIRFVEQNYARHGSHLPYIGG